MTESGTQTEANPTDQSNGADQANLDAVSMILKQAGRSADEVAALATLDDADRSAENQFSGEAPTLVSLYKSANAAEFYAGRFNPEPDVASTMGDCMDFLLKRKLAGTLLNHEEMLFHDDTISGLAERGFFGLAIPKEYGGAGAALGDLGPLLRALTFIHPDLAVMFEVHNFLGPVTPLLDFGTEEQKQYYLPRMAAGELLGSFALTEPGVGADPSKLKLTARREGDSYFISGVKWPITNVVYGGLCVLILKLENEGLKPGRDSAMILFETPKQDDQNFRMTRNRLGAFDYLWNARFRLTEYEVPADRLLGPPGKGLAQAFSSLAKGRGGICVNSAAKIFKLLAHIILDPTDYEVIENGQKRHKATGWTSFRATFGKPIGSAPRIQTWIGRAACHALASRSLGDLCFRLGANGVRDETQGMVAKVYSSDALMETAHNVYLIQGGRSVHVDERRSALRSGADGSAAKDEKLIENFIGENMHEFIIASVYEGPNPVLADMGAPNAMTRDIRAGYLEPIGLAEVEGKWGLGAMAKFGWFIAKSVAGSLNPWPGSFDGVPDLFPEKQRLAQKGLKRNRVVGRRILLIIAKYQKSFMDESLLLGCEGGAFDQLSYSMASMVYALSLEKPEPEYLKVGEALDLEADLKIAGKAETPELMRKWAEIGQLMMDPNSKLHQDWIADIEVSNIPLDPRLIDNFI